MRTQGRQTTARSTQPCDSTPIIDINQTSICLIEQSSTRLACLRCSKAPHCHSVIAPTCLAPHLLSSCPQAGQGCVSAMELTRVPLCLAVLVVCLSSSWVQQAAAHAVMFEPKSRPWYDYLLNYNYNPHAVFAGGKSSPHRCLQHSQQQWRCSSICSKLQGMSGVAAAGVRSMWALCLQLQRQCSKRGGLVSRMATTHAWRSSQGHKSTLVTPPLHVLKLTLSGSARSKSSRPSTHKELCICKLIDNKPWLIAVKPLCISNFVWSVIQSIEAKGFMATSAPSLSVALQFSYHAMTLLLFCCGWLPTRLL